MSKPGVNSSIPQGEELDKAIANADDPVMLNYAVAGDPSGEDYNFVSYNNHKAAGRQRHQNKMRDSGHGKTLKPKK